MALQAILERPQVQAARSLLRRRDGETVEEQAKIVAIPAPTGCEAERGRYVRGRFEEIGLVGLETDEVGNVLGLLPADGRAPEPAPEPVIVAAHLDTIFPAETEISLRRDGDRLLAPGITDNARGLAAMLALAEALSVAEVGTERPLLFIATVGEEGLGDLRGVKHLFRDGSPLRKASAFVSLDGAGVTRIVHRAIGSRRLRATISSVGGHSWGDRGLPNPVHALGLVVSRLRDLTPAARASGAGTGARREVAGRLAARDSAEGYAVNVGRIGGGTSVNAIPAEAWLELDLRAGDEATLDALEAGARDLIDAAVDEEAGAGRVGAPIAARVELIGTRPSGETPVDAEIVRSTIEATRAVGSEPELIASSTDANVPIALGIPSVAVGAGGIGGGVHTTGEWFTNDGGILGIERALLAVLAVAGLRPG